MDDNKNSDNIMNIGILDIGNECNQNCRQCFYNQNITIKKELADELNIVNKIRENNEICKGANITIYPKEITTTPDLIKKMGENNQEYVLTNGKDIKKNPDILKTFKENNIHKIRITLFPNKEEQLFWNRNTLSEYNDIKEGIKMSILEDIETEISTIITPQNMGYLKNFYEELYDMKVSRWRLLNFIPTGNGKNMDMKYIMDNKHLHKLLNITNGLKSGKGPYISYGLGFGPNFYGKSIYNFITQQKIKDGMIAKYPCPTINNSFLGILVKNKEIYRCFKLISNQEAKIGEIGDNGKIILHKNLKFEDKTLKDKLRGMCSRESCDFQDLCLGGCRSNAYILAKIRGEKNPEYAGQEMCITNLIQNQRKGG